MEPGAAMASRSSSSSKCQKGRSSQYINQREGISDHQWEKQSHHKLYEQHNFFLKAPTNLELILKVIPTPTDLQRKIISKTTIISKILRLSEQQSLIGAKNIKRLETWELSGGLGMLNWVEYWLEFEEKALGISLLRWFGRVLQLVFERLGCLWP